MSIRGLLDDHQGASLVRRARWLLALRELQHQAGPDRSWCTLAEWLRFWPSDADEGRDVDLAEATGKRQRHRLQSALEEIGLGLVIETPEGDGLRIHVGSVELRDLVSLEQREARAVVERSEARAEGREPELEDEDPDPREVAQIYRGSLKQQAKPVDWLARKYGRHERVIRRLLLSQGVEVRPRAPTRVELAKPADQIERALKAAARGESARAVGKMLGVSRFTAWRLAQRNGIRRPKV